MGLLVTLVMLAPCHMVPGSGRGFILVLAPGLGCVSLVPSLLPCHAWLSWVCHPAADRAVGGPGCPSLPCHQGLAEGPRSLLVLPRSSGRCRCGNFVHWGLPLKGWIARVPTRNCQAPKGRTLLSPHVLASSPAGAVCSSKHPKVWKYGSWWC